MEKSKQLRELLESLTPVFTEDGERLPVSFGMDTAIDMEGRISIQNDTRRAIGRLLDGPDELRVLVDSLNHEVAHYNHSDLRGKLAFMGEYPDAPGIAGAVVNIVEDVYVDHQRFKQHPGLRGTHAFTIDAMMGNDDRRPPVDRLYAKNPAAALVEGMVQVAFGGRVKGYDGLPDDVKATLAFVRRKARVARNTHDSDERDDIAREVTDRVVGHLQQFEIDDDSLQELVDMLEDIPTDEPDGGWPMPLDVDTDGEPADEEAADDTEDAAAAAGAAQPGGEQAGSQPLPEGQQTLTDDASDAEAGLDEQLEAEMEALAEQSEAGNSGAWYDADPEEYSEPDTTDVTRYKRLTRAIEESKGDLEKRRAERDSSISHHMEEQDWESASTDEAIAELRNTGMERKVRAAFDRLATQDFDHPAEQGHRLNMDAVVRYVSGDRTEREWYFQREIAETGDRSVAVAVDLSGSMSATQAKMALGAIAVATTTIGDELMATGYTSRKNKGHLIVAPGEDWDWDLTRGVKATGNTPTARGIRDGIALLRKASRREKVLIVITDGQANEPDYPQFTNSGTNAEQDAYNAVEDARAEGITVIGLGIGGVYEWNMKTMFGPDGYVMGDDDDLATALVNVYGKQMSTGKVELR